MRELNPFGEFFPMPNELVARSGVPDTISAWKAVSDGFLTHECCAFHRNVEISSRYAWIYRLMPAFKWAGMAAIASHHVRLALFPLRLDTDPTGYVDIPRSLVRPRLLLMEDVNTIRATNNAIFDDIFWVISHTFPPATGSNVSALSFRRSATMRLSCPASRRSTRDVVSWRTGRRPRRLDGRPKISSGRATSNSWSTSSVPWCNRTSITSRARSPG